MSAHPIQTDMKIVLDTNSLIRFHLIESDNDDNKFVDCAIISGARFIVTEDHHFNVLKQIPFPYVEVIGINAFIDFLQGN